MFSSFSCTYYDEINVVFLVIPNNTCNNRIVKFSFYCVYFIFIVDLHLSSGNYCI